MTFKRVDLDVWVVGMAPPTERQASADRPSREGDGRSNGRHGSAIFH